MPADLPPECERIAREWASRNTCMTRHALEAAVDALERLQRIHNDMHLSEGGWIWQGDGSDHLESLACPVVIQPHQLREPVRQQPDRLDEVLELLRKADILVLSGDGVGHVERGAHEHCFNNADEMLSTLRALAKPQEQQDIETIEQWLPPQDNDMPTGVYGAIRRLVEQVKQLRVERELITDALVCRRVVCRTRLGSAPKGKRRVGKNVGRMESIHRFLKTCTGGNMQHQNLYWRQYATPLSI